MTIVIGFGNSDDKLTQAEWAQFVDDITHLVIDEPLVQMHGAWFSLPHSTYQNGGLCFDLDNRGVRMQLRADLRALAERYRQDSISWLEGETEFMAAGEATGQ